MGIRETANHGMGRYRHLKMCRFSLQLPKPIAIPQSF